MGTHQMTSVTFCACCGAGMLHVEAETCSSYCRAQLAVRRASMVSTTELLERAERAVPAAEYKMQAYGPSGPIENYRDMGFDEYQPSGPVYFGTDIPVQREVQTYELDRPEQRDRAPAVIVWAMGGIFVTLGLLLVWAFS